MTCPSVIAGSVVNQSGSVNGWSSAYIDACGDRQGVVETPGANSQFQYPIILSDVAGVGTRYQQNKIVKGEHWLLLGLAAGRFDSNPLPFPAPGTKNIGVSWDDGFGNHYEWVVTYVAKSSKNCNASEETATSGTITLTNMNTALVEGSYDLYFGSDHVTGTFSAPRAAIAGAMIPEDFTGCPTRPSNQSCVSA